MPIEISFIDKTLHKYFNDLRNLKNIDSKLAVCSFLTVIYFPIQISGKIYCYMFWIYKSNHWVAFINRNKHQHFSILVKIMNRIKNF